MNVHELVELVETYRDESGGASSITALVVHVWNEAIDRAARELEYGRRDSADLRALKIEDYP